MFRGEGQALALETSPCLTLVETPRPSGRQEPPQVGPQNHLVLPRKHRSAAHKQFWEKGALERPQPRPVGSLEEQSWGPRPEPSRLTGHQKEDGGGAGSVAVAPWAPTVTP